MKNLPVPQPSFLPQPCALPPLLVSEPDTARLLALGRSQVKRLIAEGMLRRVEIDGLSRVTTASIVAYVDRLAGERGKGPAADETAGRVDDDEADNTSGLPAADTKHGGHRARAFYPK